MQTVEYVLGVQEILLPTIRIYTSHYVFVDQNVTMPIFGLPYGTEDIEKTNMTF